MTVTVARIRSFVDQMNKTAKDYDENALAIWMLLTKEEQAELIHIAHARPPVFDGYKVEHPIRIKLVEAGLAARTNYGGEIGYTMMSFIGYAVIKAGSPPPDNVTLPGEVNDKHRVDLGSR